MSRCLVLAMTVALPGGTLWAANPAPVNLGTAKNFGALAGAAISGTGQVKGNVGSGSGAIAPAITSTGTIYPTGDAVVMTALADVATAYAEAKGRTPDVVLSGAAFELGGKTLMPGVHKIGAAATLGSPVTLDAQGDPDAVFIIQIGAAFSATASVGNVILANDAQSANVYWIVEGAVSMGASINMEGNILGNAAVTFGATTIVNGRLLAGAAAGTIAMATAINVPVDPSVVGDRVWFDSNVNGIQDPSETTGFSNIPVSLMQLVLEKKTLELGTAANFGALAGAAISGSANVTGNVGSGTGAIAPAVTSPAGTVYATGHAAVITALADFAAAYANGKNRTPDFLLSAAAHELGGATLTPGVYKIGAAATLASPVTLDAQGDAEAVFIIQIVGAFGTTAATGNVVLANQAKSANVYWVVEGAVSLGAGTQMQGNILGGAAITAGATTNISGRLMAGTGAGTIALATTVSAVTGAPPVGFPPPIVVASTVTDGSGNYLFEGVQPGTLFVRWDLTNFTSDYRVTDPNQGGDDALDSDSASGDVGGYVHSTAFVVLGGTTHLGMDLGMAETLPAVKTAARNELAATRQAYLLANPYTSENWTALLNAKTDGDTAINAATDPAGVAAAKAAALAAMDAVPTVPDTLAAAKVAAKADLTTALAAYLEADYTAENWTILNVAKTNGDAAIQAAADLAAVATKRSAALAAMDAVPTVAGTLAAAKTAAQNDLALVAATYLEANYTPGGWTAFQSAKANGQIAINAATNLAGVVTATNAALATLAAVPTFTETMVTARAAALSDLTTALAAYLEANYYTSENWTALIAARTAGSAAVNAAIDPAGVATARSAALAAMDAVPTVTESLATAKAAALNDLALAAATYVQANYTPGNWTVLQTAFTNGQAAINAATNLAGVGTATNAALATMDAVPVIDETMATARAAALNELTTAFATYLEANYYTSENWTALIAARAAGSAAINAATDPAGVATARDAALAAMEAVPTMSWMLAVAKAAALNDFALAAATYLQANYTVENWTALQTAKANGQAAINAATDLAGVATATNAALAAMDAVPVINQTVATARAAALNDLTTAFSTYLQANNYTSENLMALIAARAAGSAAVNAATDEAGVATAANTALAAMDAVPTIPETLATAKAAALNDLALVAATYVEGKYTPGNWTTLQTANTNGQAAINAATNLADVATATNAALAAMDAVPVINTAMATARATALSDLTTAFATLLAANNYTSENLMALIAARAAGSAAVNAATDPAGVATAANTALAAMDAVPTVVGTLTVAKAAALSDFAVVVATYLEANYTAENWTALQTADANGQIAINAATSLAGVAMATNAALATLDAVPTFAETMAVAKAAALNALTTAFTTYLEANNYTSENLIALIAARTAGSAAVNAATDPAGVATARNQALAAMDVVPTYIETLAAAQAAALANLVAVAATYSEANYTPAEWAALQLALANALAAINAATDLAGVATATNTALVALDAVPTIAEETLAAIKAAALANLAALAATYQQANFTPEQWAALQLALANAQAAINAATNPASVALATSAALAALDAVPTSAETLAAAQAAALANLAAVAATYQQANYTPEQWAALQLALANAQAAINAATGLAGLATVTNTALAAMDAVPTIAEETLAAVQAAALANLAALAATYQQANFTPEQWAALQLVLANAQAAINAATNAANVALATSAALAALDAVPTSAETLAAAQAAALANLAAVAATYQQANFTPEQWAALQLALANAQAAINAATNLAGVATATNTALVALDTVPTIAEMLAAIKAAALANLAALAATYQQANFTPEQWAALQLALANAQAAINAATNAAGVALATSAALTALDTVPTNAQTLAAAQAAALANLLAVAATYQQSNFTPEQWAALQLALANALAAINAATDLAGVATATNTGVTTLAILATGTPTLTLVTPATGTTAGGTVVTLTGNNFIGATVVTFGGIPASFTVQSDTEITATTPARVAGPVTVLVTTPSGSNIVNTLFTYQTPTIVVIGDGISIGNGEASSAFGSVSLLNAQVTRTFTIQNSGSAAFVLTGSPAVQILGADAADFKVTAQPSTSIAVGQSTTFAITFDPRMPGLRTATVSIASNNPDYNPFTFAVSGFGTLSRSRAQTIVFTAPTTHYLAQGSLILNAEASSGFPVTLQVIAGPGTLAGSILTPTGVGKVTVLATQPGGGNYAYAKAVKRVITVKANPTVLTLTGLSQRYDGTPKIIGSVGIAGPVSVTYQVGGVFRTTPPTATGRYPVLAVAGGVTKKGTLVITQAPLYVVPQDKRKFAGELNPMLDLVYEGFVGSDTPAVLTKVPTLSTSAKVTSAGGTYPITAKGGLAANYTLIYRQGTLVVESFAAGYEALLADGGNLPSGKLSLTVATTGKSFSGTIVLAGETSALRLSGALMTNSLTELATGTSTVASRGATYALSFTLTMQGELTGSLTKNSQPLATFLEGQRLLLLPSGAKVNFSGAYTGVLEPALPQGTGVPAGAGWARATVSTRGAIALVGKLGDGTAFTTSVLPSQEEMPSYRLWVQPYKPTRVETFLGGTFELQPNSLNSQRFMVADASLTWVKAARTADKSYPLGFVPLTVGLTLDPWVKPTASLPLKGLLGLTGDTLRVAHSPTGSTSDASLPTALTLSSRNVIGVAGISNLAKWKTTLNTANGTFTGSFELMDAGVKRVAIFSGVLRQPAGNQIEVIGDGHFVIPATPGAVQTASGEVLFRLP